MKNPCVALSFLIHLAMNKQRLLFSINLVKNSRAHCNNTVDTNRQVSPIWHRYYIELSLMHWEAFISVTMTTRWYSYLFLLCMCEYVCVGLCVGVLFIGACRVCEGLCV